MYWEIKSHPLNAPYNIETLPFSIHKFDNNYTFVTHSNLLKLSKLEIQLKTCCELGSIWPTFLYNLFCWLMGSVQNPLTQTTMSTMFKCYLFHGNIKTLQFHFRAQLFLQLIGIHRRLALNDVFCVKKNKSSAVFISICRRF